MITDEVQGTFWLIKNQHNKENMLREANAIEPSADNFMAVQIQPYKPKKSASQRAYLWGWVYAQTARILDERGIAFPLVSGYERPATKDILHAMGQEAFLICGQIKKKDGSLVNMYTSTESLSKRDYWAYTENFTRLVYQVWGVTIPLPPADSYYDQLLKEIKPRAEK